MNSRHRHRKKDTRDHVLTPKKAEEKGRISRRSLRNPQGLRFERAPHFLTNLIREFDPPSNEMIRIHLAYGEWELDRAHFNSPNEKTSSKTNKIWSQVRFRVYYAGTTIVYAPCNRALITIWGDRRKKWNEKDFKDWVHGKSLVEKNKEDVAKILLQSSPVKSTSRSWASVTLAKPISTQPIFHDSISDSGSEIGIDPRPTSPIRVAWKQEYTTSPISSWSVSTVCDWAKAVGIKMEAVHVFKKEEIDGQALLTLDENDFEVMNKFAGRRVFNMGTRRKVELERAKVLERQEIHGKRA